MRSRLLTCAFVIAAFVLTALDPSGAAAQFRVLPNGVPAYAPPPPPRYFGVLPHDYPPIHPPPMPPIIYPATYYSSYGYTYPAYRVYPTPVYVPPYHASFYSTYWYPAGYSYYYYRGW
jgi:hypothetical protein